MTRRAVVTLGLCASVALIVAATLVPFGALQSPRVPARWCLVCGELWLTDGISNVVLFAPFGIALSLLGVRWWRVASISFAFSLLIEYMQSIGLPPARSAAWADVVANTLGGLAGVLVVQLRQWAVAPTPRLATRLTLLWSFGAIAVLAFTSRALGFHDDARDVGIYKRSSYDHTPGMGWFGGVVEFASVDTFRTTQRGTGPVMVETAVEPRTVTMAAVLRGREEGNALVPIVFVHKIGDTSAVTFIGERANAAELLVSRKAWDWGLAMPSLTLPGVFANRTVTDTRVLRLSAIAAPDHLELHARSAYFDGDRTMLLTPTLGWTMIQTLIKRDSTFAIVARVGWLITLVFPIGWFGAQSGARWKSILGVAIGIVVLSVSTMPRVFGVAPIALGEWETMTLLVVSAAIVARQRLRAVSR